MIKQFKQLDINANNGAQFKLDAGKKAFGLSLTVIALMLTNASASAACKGANCACEASVIEFSSPVLTKNDDGEYPISLEADNVEADGDDLVTLTGNAEVAQGRQTIVADQLQYYRDSERVVANGRVEMISEDGDYLASESIDVHVPTQIGRLSEVEFKLSKGLKRADGIDTVEVQSRGSAGVVNLEGEGLVRLENAKYTTCPEGNDSVMMSAQQLTLDQTGGVGTARNATVRFKGVPVFYLPYVTFPLNDQRKTGFLTPGFGSDEESGNIIDIPWYWNISKNQDATITPRYYTDRGFQVGAEYRMRTQNSSAYVYGEMLPDDEIFGDDRRLLTVQYSHQFTDNLSAKVNYNDVSDIDYFNDLRNDIRYFSATYVPRDVQVNYSHDYFQVSARANEYQIIDSRVSALNAPYERLPSLRFSTNLPKGPYGLEYGVNASYTNFSSDERVEGTRMAVSPYVELPLENLWGYVKPALSINARSYSLDNVADGAEDSPSYTVPILSVDSGVYLEKNTHWLGESALQTLEPRLFYVYAPEENQDDVVTFDTSQKQLNNFSNIFSTNRFYGEDRIGDTNQVTLGLTTKIIDSETGNQRLKASIGQLYLLDDLEVGLNANQAPIESGLGDLLAELRTESEGPWTTYTFLQYNHDESELTTSRFALGYEPKDDDRKNINVGYYRSTFLNRTVDQLTVDAHWPISDRWQFFGSERYSLEDSESLSRTIGLEYNGCCWKMRFIGANQINNRLRRNNVTGTEEDKKTSFFIELELTSLGRLRTGL